jgi:hypothetical protein
MEHSRENNLLRDLNSVLDSNSIGSDSNTKNYVLAKYLLDCINTFNKTIKLREEWKDVKND